MKSFLSADKQKLVEEGKGSKPQGQMISLISNHDGR